MAKTIKFNLICDEKPVRTIEDLQNNFSIEDVLAYYNNQLLHRWLSVRGYGRELEAVTAIESNDSMEIIKELIRIFDIPADEKKVEESIYMLKYLDERKELCAIYKQENYNAQKIIDDHKAGYERLVNGILEKPDDAALIKANIAEIVSNYAWILELDHRNLFYALREKSFLAVMCLLMNEKSRNYYLPVKIIGEDGTSQLDTEKNQDKEKMYDEICKGISQPFHLKSFLGKNLTTFAGMTDGHWKDLEPKGKRYMIISMDIGDYVRPAGQSGGELSCADILNKFVIVDGIDYKSKNGYHVLRYMEV